MVGLSDRGTYILDQWERGLKGYQEICGIYGRGGQDVAGEVE